MESRGKDDDGLDDVTPSSELARADIATMASSIIDLITDLKTSCSLSYRSERQRPWSVDDAGAEDEHIYEEIANDSTAIHLHDACVRPPPLPERRGLGRSTASTTATTPSTPAAREFPPILRKKKMPSKHREASVRWEDELACASLGRRLTRGRRVTAALAQGGGGRATETKDFLTMPAASSIRATFA